MTIKTKQLGNLGEDLAVKYLKKKGHEILHRNFRYKKYGELDIITKKDEDLHFVEVKTRETISKDFLPEDNITYFKQKQLIKLSKIYLIEHPPAGGTNTDVPWQIDVICVQINPINRKIKIRYIEQAVVDFV